MFGKNKRTGKNSSASATRRTRSTEAGTEVGHETSSTRRSKSSNKSTN